MPKFIFHMGVTLRSYGNVEVEADSVETALKLLTADFVGEHIDITETTKDSGQELAVLDIRHATTGEAIAGYDHMFLPSPYDPQPNAALLALLKDAREVVNGVAERMEGAAGSPLLKRIDAAITRAEAA